MTKDSTRKWILALLFGLLLWSFLFFTRKFWYSPWCAVTPSPCLTDSVNAFDRIVFQFKSVKADFWSNLIQNFVGLGVFLVPWFLFNKKSALEETLVTATVSFTNLAVLEVVRLLVQRPRPLIFNDVLGDGRNINAYTSFYSGHTSFVALAMLSFYFILNRRFLNLSALAKRNLVFVYLALSITTGVFRVLGGRHYPTDVLAGLIIGSSIAFVIQKRFDSLRQ